jgi:hypothetical protein
MFREDDVNFGFITCSDQLIGGSPRIPLLHCQFSVAVPQRMIQNAPVSCYIRMNREECANL